MTHQRALLVSCRRVLWLQRLQHHKSQVARASSGERERERAAHDDDYHRLAAAATSGPFSRSAIQTAGWPPVLGAKYCAAQPLSAVWRRRCATRFLRGSCFASISHANERASDGQFFFGQKFACCSTVGSVQLSVRQQLIAYTSVQLTTCGANDNNRQSCRLASARPSSAAAAARVCQCDAD